MKFKANIQECNVNRTLCLYPVMGIKEEKSYLDTVFM